MLLYKLAILFLNFSCYNNDYFFFDFHNFSLYDQSRIMHVVYILVGSWRRQDMTSLKQRATTFRFRHDYWTQDRADCFIEHRLEALLRQCWTL